MGSGYLARKVFSVVIVDGGRLDVGVTGESLNRSQIVARIKILCDRGMSDAVGANPHSGNL